VCLKWRTIERYGEETEIQEAREKLIEIQGNLKITRGAKRGSNSSNRGQEPKRKNLNAAKYSADFHLVVERNPMLQVAASQSY